MNQLPNPSPAHDAVLLRELLASGSLTRAQLQRRTGLRSNTVIDAAEAMQQAGLIRTAGRADVSQRRGGESRGRPAVLLEIDPDCRDVLGLAIKPHRVEAARLNLLGQPTGDAAGEPVDREDRLIDVASDLLGGLVKDSTLAVGISSPGLIDQTQMQLLFSASAPHLPGLSLTPMLSRIGDAPVALENDMQALGDRWRLAHPDAADETALLVGLGDGRVGASLMPAGYPADAGCVRGGNELGHMQVASFGHDVPRCFCGQDRCVERVFSSTMIHRLSGRRCRLEHALRLDATAGDNPAADAGRWVCDRLAEAIANAVNFSRPHRVVLANLGLGDTFVSPLCRHLEASVRGKLLPALRDRVQFKPWQLPTADRKDSATTDAQTAGHLALAVLTGRRSPTAGRPAEV